MSRALTPKTTLENLRKDAKRWLKALRAGDPAAKARLKAAWPGAPAEPGLRDVQQGLAREYGQESWIALRAALDDLVLARRGTDEQVEFILRSAWDGDVEAARRLLRRHPELATANLHMAATCGDLAEVERRLTKEPADAKAGPLGWTALTCVTYGRLDEANAVAIAGRLLDAGADPNAAFNDGWDSPFKVLTGAIRLGEGARPSHAQALQLVDLLIAAGADPFDPQTLYNISIGGDDDATAWYDRLWDYCVKAGVEGRWREPAVGLGGKKGVTALDYLLNNAVGQNQISRAEWLLERGADPNAPSIYSHWPSLMAAKLSGFLEMAALLERRGAKPAPMTGVDAFQAACMAGDRAQAEALLAADPSLLQQPRPLLSAAELGNERAVEVLLSLGAPVDALDRDGISPLHRAVQSGSLTMVQQMVAAGADVDLRERRWNGTPMSWAVVLGKPAIADYLAPLSHDVRPLAYQGRLERLEAVLRERPERALVSLPGDNGATTLFALPDDDEEKAVAVARMLLAYGVDPTIRNPKGLTAADLARLHGHDEVAELIEAAHAR